MKRHAHTRFLLRILSNDLSRWLLVLIVLLCANCQSTEVHVCGDRTCPTDKVCSPDKQSCVLQAQVEACAFRLVGAECTYPGVPRGACFSGVCRTTGCGNDEVELTEVCDDGNTISGDGCSADCQSDETCGNGITDVAMNETCDEGDDNGDQPDALCRQDCSIQRCGDEIADSVAGESCDGSDLQGQSCESLGYYGGDLSCLSLCVFDLRSCNGICGDGARTDAETCDGSDYGGQSCSSFGFYTGALSCNESCDAISTAGCSTFCGDQVINGNEVCDGNALGGLSCDTFGYQQGTVSCADDCSSVDTSWCDGYCGDGQLNGFEQCDGSDFSGQSCSDFGASSGPLTCDATCRPTLERCHWGQWRSTRLQGTGDLHAVWGSSSDNLWAVGDNGSVHHWSGESWNREFIASVAPLHGLWGSSPTDIWAVGGTSRAVILHYDGQSWTTVVNNPLEDGLRAVWGSAANDVWAVGDSGSSYHFDGTSWQTEMISAGASDWAAVWGSASNDVWVGGDGLWHYDGAQWTPSLFPFVGVNTKHDSLWGDETGALFTTSGRNLYHQLDQVWSELQSTDAQTVGGSSSEDIWLTHTDSTISHFDGSSWTRESSGGLYPLQAIQVMSASSVRAVGTAHSVASYDGPGWQAGPAQTSSEMNAVWASANDNVWAAGESGAFMHYDGLGWSTLSLGSESTYAMWSSAADNIWAVGSAGMMAHFDGSTWTLNSPITDQPLTAVWGNSSADVWAVGWAGTLLHFDGTNWSVVDAPAIGQSHLNGLWGSAADNIWAAGFGALYHYDGNAWSFVTPPLQISYGGIWGSGSDDVWVLGELGSLLHFNGVQWQEVSLASSENWLGIWGYHASEVWVVGTEAYWHFDGSNWASFRSPDTVLSNAIFGTSPEDVWVLGVGNIMHLDQRLHTAHGGACSSPIAIYCETQLHGNISANTDKKLSSYGCGGRSLLGGEAVYRFASPMRGQVDITLTPTSGDLDLLVLADDAQGACDLGACKGSSQTEGLGQMETTSIDVVQGERLYLVVDSVQEAPSGYTITVSCTKN